MALPPKKEVKLDEVSEATLLRLLCNRINMSPTVPRNTTYHGKWVEGLVAIGNDETAHIRMTKEGWETLNQYLVP